MGIVSQITSCLKGLNILLILTNFFRLPVAIVRTVKQPRVEMLHPLRKTISCVKGFRVTACVTFYVSFDLPDVSVDSISVLFLVHLFSWTFATRINFCSLSYIDTLLLFFFIDSIKFVFWFKKNKGGKWNSLMLLVYKIVTRCRNWRNGTIHVWKESLLNLWRIEWFLKRIPWELIRKGCLHWGMQMHFGKWTGKYIFIPLVVPFPWYMENLTKQHHLFRFCIDWNVWFRCWTGIKQ